MNDFYDELRKALCSRKLSKQEVAKLKKMLCKKHGLATIPRDADVFLHSKNKGIVTKPSRTASGVAPVAIMTRPIACRHGKCLYCPGGPKSVFGNMPQSYTGREPATMRGLRNNFDPYLQVFNRLEQYAATGHVPGKVELIVMGGTFPSFPTRYQDGFVAFALKAMNDFAQMFFTKNGILKISEYKNFFELPGSIASPERIARIQKKILELKGRAVLSKEQKRNETAGIRCVAMCVETRPDFCSEKEVRQMLKLGVTRVELGVQSLDDKVLRRIKRGHCVHDSVKATELLKNKFLKVGYHIMPGLPGSSPEQDIEMFRELFSNPAFMPDALKIYPCLVVRGTGLYGLWKRGKYSPLTTEQASEIIIRAKEFVPEWCRIMRVQRDIPTTVVSAGVDRTNLRQYVEKLMKDRGKKCRCIRCREPRGRKTGKKVVFKTTRYVASNGTEFFISANDVENDFLLGFCRLRINNDGSAGIRELHVYGASVPVGRKACSGAVQHRGIGKKLLSIAEKIALESFGAKKLFVISGIGVREYYKKLGYKKEGAYVAKELKKS